MNIKNLPQGSRGESSIDLTIVKNKMLANIQKWDIADEKKVLRITILLNLILLLSMTKGESPMTQEDLE